MTTTNLITAAVTVDSATYAITLNSEGAVSISRDGVWSGDGRWDADARRIEDCAADLGEEVYEALEEALEDALEEADADDTHDAVIASVLAQRPDFSREEVEAACEGNPDLFDGQVIERVLAAREAAEAERREVEAALSNHVHDPADHRRDDGSYIIPIEDDGESEDAEDTRLEIQADLPAGWFAEWTGSGNSDADGFTTSDLCVSKGSL